MKTIVQITDTHIVPYGQQWRNDENSNTDKRLELVVNHINNLSILPDFVIHTGDIVDNGSKESYQNAKRILDKLHTKYFLTCGNHDNFNNLKQVFTSHNYFEDSKFSHYVINYDNLKIIVLDTQVEGEVHGYLCDYRIKWLESVLKLSNVPTVIFMHHFPIEVSNILFKGMNLRESKSFKELISHYPNIIGIYCGHYHHFKKDTFASKICWISPSTAPSHSLTKDTQVILNYTKPSYSLHTFNRKNELISKVVRL